MRGESVTFCSTVMCGNRLKAWKTMPMCWRSSFTSSLPLVMFCPSNVIEPASTFSSRLMQRSSVDLPEPEAPIRQTTSCAAMSRLDVRQHLVLAERLGDVLDLDEALVAHWAARSRSSRWRMMLSVKRASGIVRITKKTAATV